MSRHEHSNESMGYSYFFSSGCLMIHESEFSVDFLIFFLVQLDRSSGIFLPAFCFKLHEANGSGKMKDSS